MYQTAIQLVSDSEPVALVDSTSAGVPMFAFMATSTPRSLAEQGMSLPDSLLKAFQVANEHRQALSACLHTLVGVQAISDSTLKGLFGGDDDKGWERFRSRYRPIRRFVLVSLPLTLSDSSVLVYAAYASDWLAGEGALVQLQRDASGRWFKKSMAVVWVS
jgi:hypothetical protein